MVSSSSYFDVDFRMFFVRNSMTTFEGFKKEFPRVQTDKFIYQKTKGKKILVLSDDPIKYFSSPYFIIPNLLSKKKSLYGIVFYKKIIKTKNQGFQKIVNLINYDRYKSRFLGDGLNTPYGNNWLKFLIENENTYDKFSIDNDFVLLIDLEKFSTNYKVFYNESKGD